MSIKLTNGTIAVANQLLFDNVTLDFIDGGFYRIHGENGIGKTVLLNTLLGLNPLRKGQLTNTYTKQETVYIPDSNIFFDDEKVSDVFNMLRFFYKITSEEALAILSQLNMEVDGLAKKYIAELSFGMKKKLMLLPLFLTNVRLFVLDEIFVGLDDVTQQVVIDRLIALHRQGSTIILVEHNGHLVARLQEQIRMEELQCQKGLINGIS